MNNFMSPKETVEYLNDRNIPVTEMTLSRWRDKGRVPPFSKIGGRFFYSVDDIDRWVFRNEGAP